MARRKKRKAESIKEGKTIASEYMEMKAERQPYLDKAKKASEYTFPTMYTNTTNTRDNIKSPKRANKTPNQSIAADGINNLSAKITLTMLPPNQPFFRFMLDSLKEKTYPENEVQLINHGLAVTENMVTNYIEELGDRVCAGEGFKHLYIAGNVFFIHDPENGLRYYPLDRFCVKRDYTGNVLKAITEETVAVSALEPEIREQICEKVIERLVENGEDINNIEEKEVVLYTCFRREKNKWTVVQEIEGVKLEKTKGTYPIEISPFIALRYTRIDGESYGRSLVDEYIADISYLDCILKAIKEASLAASKFVALVNPQGTTKIKDLAEAPNGGFAQGRADDVTILQANKYYDLQTAQNMADKIERRLNRIFVMKAAIQRQAERVTAEEIRQMASDLEEALGNHYALMCREFQLAYIKIVYFHLKKVKHKELPDLIRNEDYHITVTTGLEALNKTSELQKLSMFFKMMSEFAQSAQIIGAKTDLIALKVANSLNLDIQEMLYTEEEKQQMQQQAQEQEMMKQVTPEMINQMGGLEQERMKLEGQNGKEEQ